MIYQMIFILDLLSFIIMYIHYVRLIKIQKGIERSEDILAFLIIKMAFELLEL